MHAADGSWRKCRTCLCTLEMVVVSSSSIKLYSTSWKKMANRIWRYALALFVVPSNFLTHLPSTELDSSSSMARRVTRENGRATHKVLTYLR